MALAALWSAGRVFAAAFATVARDGVGPRWAGVV